MIDLVFAASDFTRLREHVLASEYESCALLFASQTTTGDGRVRLLVREMDFPVESEYSRRGVLESELRPEIVARASKRARLNNHSLVFAHSHPGSEPPQFSLVDDRGEVALAAFVSRRNSEHVHGALVISAGGVRGRQLGLKTEVRVVTVGSERLVVFDPSAATSDIDDAFDRQVKAFGRGGQRILHALRVGIVGLGGTGSIVAEQLAHLGVRDFVLVDPDVLDATNLNRVVGATPRDVDRPKVEIAERAIKDLAPTAMVAGYVEDIIRARTARRLRDVDVVFGCTDSHGSRAVLQQLAYQYLIPCIDLGTTISVLDGVIQHIIGRVQMLAPGLGCFNCNSLLDPAQVRRDMMTAFERRADPYLQGAQVPAPAVISINGAVSSLAVTMFLAAFTGVPSPARYVLYDARRSTLRTISSAMQPNCFICSRSGALARGDEWELMTRQD